MPLGAAVFEGTFPVSEVAVAFATEGGIVPDSDAEPDCGAFAEVDPVGAVADCATVAGVDVDEASPA